MVQGTFENFHHASKCQREAFFLKEELLDLRLIYPNMKLTLHNKKDKNKSK